MQPATIQKLAKQEFAFATFPEVRIYDKPGGKKKSIQHLLFGDVITPPKLAKGKGYQKWAKELTKEVDGETWVQVRSRQTEGWVKLSNLQMNRTLEVNFVDIGQGDGCHLVTPDDKHYIIDAGQTITCTGFCAGVLTSVRPGRSCRNLPPLSRTRTRTTGFRV